MPPPQAQPRPMIAKSELSAALIAAKTQTYADTTFSTSGAKGSPSLAGVIRSLSWSPSGSLIATADSRILRVWNPEKNGVRYSTELKTPSSSAPGGSASATAGHLGGIKKLAWNPRKEAELASIGEDGVLRIWDVRAKNPLAHSIDTDGHAIDLAWRPDGHELTVLSRNDVLKPISLKTMTEIDRFPHAEQINGISYANSGNELFLAMHTGFLKALDYPTFKELHRWPSHGKSAHVVLQSPSGEHLAMGGDLPACSIRDTAETFFITVALDGLAGPVKALSFSYDSRFIVCGQNSTPGLLVHHVGTGAVLHAVKTGAPPGQVAFHPFRYLIAYSAEPGTLKVHGAIGDSL